MNDERFERLTEATDRLIEKDRIIMQARMLPEDRELTIEEISEVREAVRDVIFDGTQRVVSNKTISDQSKCAASVVSQFMSGTYAGNNNEVARKLNDWLERRLRKEGTTRKEVYISTHVAELMSGAIDMAHRMCRMAAIVSPSGSGKDKVIRALRRRYNSIVIYAERHSMTPLMLVRAIGEQLGLSRNRLQMGDTLAKVIDALKGHDHTIIINEAQQLRPECASTVRAIYDQAHTPIILIGSMAILEFVDDRSSGGGQFSRRCIRLNILERLKTEQYKGPGGKVHDAGRPLFTADEVRQFLEARQVRLTPEAFALAIVVANLVDHGSYGLMCDVVDAATELYKPGAKGLTRNHLLSVMTLLLGETEFGMANRNMAAMEQDTRYSAIVA